MTYAKHAPETVIFHAKPLTLLMRLFQVSTSAKNGAILAGVGRGQ